MSGDTLVIFVDVDDTLIRTAGSKRIPVSGVCDHVLQLYQEGAELYCWSSGGGAYAREVAIELELEHCFLAFLPKPQVMLDDQEVTKWRRLVQIHPGRCATMTMDQYRQQLYQ